MQTIEEMMAEVVDGLEQEKGPTFGGARRNQGVSADVSWPTSWIEVENVIDQWQGSKGFKGQGSIGFGGWRHNGRRNSIPVWCSSRL